MNYELWTSNIQYKYAIKGTSTQNVQKVKIKAVLFNKMQLLCISWIFFQFSHGQCIGNLTLKCKLVLLYLWLPRIDSFAVHCPPIECGLFVTHDQPKQLQCTLKLSWTYRSTYVFCFADNEVYGGWGQRLILWCRIHVYISQSCFCIYMNVGTILMVRALFSYFLAVCLIAN